MGTFIQSHLHDYHSCTSLSVSAAGYLLEKSRLIAFAQGQRVSGVWASNLLVTSPFSQSNRSYSCLKSSAPHSPSPLKWPLNHHMPSITQLWGGCILPQHSSLSVCLPGSGEDALNNTTSLMDVKSGLKVQKRTAEIRETTLSEREGAGVMPNVLGPLLCGVGELSLPNLETWHLFRHVLLTDVYSRWQDSLVYSLKTGAEWYLPVMLEPLQAGLYAVMKVRKPEIKPFVR